MGSSIDETTRQIIGSDASPEYIRQACEASLQRLNTDYIDLYQFHLNDYDPNQAGAVRDVLEELVAEGKIRQYGWSTDFPERARVFAEGPNCTTVQHQMNVLDADNSHSWLQGRGTSWGEHCRNATWAVGCQANA